MSGHVILESKFRNKKRTKDSAFGLFVFSVQSSVTIAKYTYQWMALAQQDKKIKTLLHW